MSYNDLLLELYSSKITDLIELFNELNNSPIEEDHNFSWPLLLRINEEEYANAPVKLMVFGQEATGWNNQTNSHIKTNSANTLTEEYILHDLGRNRINTSHLFRVMHGLNKRLGNPDNNCFVYNNILKFGKEVGKGHPSDGVMDREMRALNVIPREIAILKPDVCIFLTGPKYDSDIQKKFPEVEFISIDGYAPNWVVQLKHKDLPHKSYRTYHPQHIYQFGSIERRKEYERVLEEIVKLCSNK